MDEIKPFTDGISKALLHVLNKAVTASTRVLEMSGLQDQFHSAADSLYDYPITTLLIIVHFITVLFKIRTSEGSSFASSNPFGSVLSSVLLCFAGSVIQNLMLGIPPVKPFANSYLILVLILIWYLMHFCPLDIFTKLVTFFPIRVLLVLDPTQVIRAYSTQHLFYLLYRRTSSVENPETNFPLVQSVVPHLYAGYIMCSRVVLIVLKEVYRIKCILLGLKLAASLFPDAWFVIIAGGSIRGCGSMVLKPFVHQIVGLGTPRIEFHRPTFTTKISIIMSCVFALQVKGLINVNLSSLSLIFTVFIAIFQLLFLFTDQTDPFAPLENTLTAIFLRHPDQTASTSSNERKKKSD